MLHHAKFHGNNFQNNKVTAIYTLGTLNVLLILVSVPNKFTHTLGPDKSSTLGITVLSLKHLKENQNVCYK